MLSPRMHPPFRSSSAASSLPASPPTRCCPCRLPPACPSAELPLAANDGATRLAAADMMSSLGARCRWRFGMHTQAVGWSLVAARSPLSAGGTSKAIERLFVVCSGAPRRPWPFRQAQARSAGPAWRAAAGDGVRHTGVHHCCVRASCACPQAPVCATHCYLLKRSICSRPRPSLSATAVEQGGNRTSRTGHPQTQRAIRPCT